MAILNYATSYETIKNYLNLQESNSDDYVKLFFTKDGHIVTHGVDYTKDYNGGVRGLVPNYNSDLGERGVLSNNGWVDIFSILPTDGTINISDTTHIPTNAQVAKYIGDTIKTAETLRFKGGVGYKNNFYYHIPVGGTETTGFPKDCKVGDSYRILTNGTTVADGSQQAGDMIICIKNTTSQGETGSEYWLVVQANIQGTSQITINGNVYKIYTDSVIEDKSIYAPSEKGTKGQLLISSGGNIPNWANFNISNTGVLTLAKDNETYLSANIIANKVQKTLKAGTGFTGNDFDGSTEQTWNLNIASKTSLGGIIIDNNDKPTVSIDSNGRIFLDANNIYNALGYQPVNPEIVGIYKLVLGNSNISNTPVTNILNPYINLIGNPTSSIQILGSGKISVLGNTDTISISLGAASDSDLGGIKTNYTSSDYNYAVKVDDSGNAYVNIPWKSTTRDITINGTSIGSETTLNFIPTGDIYIKADSNQNNIVDLSFGLSWYNIDNEEYEYDSGVYN